jgi:hypothetical protein
VAAGPAQQARVTVLFRWLLLIPHYFVLYFLGLAAAVVAFIGWWGALFTGRLPEFAATYLTGLIRWYARVQAYAMLLTDAYPPFSLDDDPGYPVRIAVPPGDTLNRAAVFFRFILVFPANVLNSLVIFGGTTIVGFIAWLIALVSGQLPASLHQAYTAILRYTTRVTSYFYMLTPAYPGGLFGDGPAVPGGYGTPGYGAPAYGAPGYGAAGYGAAGYGAADYPAADGYGAPAAPWPADWRLLLTRGAKQLIGWFIGIGALFWVGWVIVLSVLASSSGNAIVTSNAIDTMNAANNTLTTEANGWRGTVQSCGADVACVTKADATAATFFTRFASTLRTTPMPPRAVAAADQLYADATKIARDLTQLSTATNGAQYQTIATSSALDATLNQFDTDNNALGTALNNS